MTSDLLELHKGLVGNHGVVQLLHDDLAHVCLGQQEFGMLHHWLPDQRGFSLGLEDREHGGRGGRDGDMMDNWSVRLQGEKEKDVIQKKKCVHSNN